MSQSYSEQKFWIPNVSEGCLGSDSVLLFLYCPLPFNWPSSETCSLLFCHPCHVTNGSGHCQSIHSKQRRGMESEKNCQNHSWTRSNVWCLPRNKKRIEGEICHKTSKSYSNMERMKDTLSKNRSKNVLSFYSFFRPGMWCVCLWSNHCLFLCQGKLADCDCYNCPKMVETGKNGSACVIVHLGIVCFMGLKNQSHEMIFSQKKNTFEFVDEKFRTERKSEC